MTPTGARPEAFAKCVEHMQAQDFIGKVRWVIVDDGPEAMPTPSVKDWQIVHVRPTPLWQPGQNTQHRNMLEGLALCEGKVVIVEDDDEYAPWWLRKMDKWLEHHDLVGEGQSVYINLKSGKRMQHKNMSHASLCQTGVKGAGITALRKACESGEKFIDMQLWRSVKGFVHPYMGGVVGIKGYPGRPGIGMGHRL